MREERFGKEKGKGKAKGLKGKGRQAGPSTLNEEAEATAINGRVTADHERAFIRPHSEAGFRKTLGASGWALAVPFDPRVVDAEMMARGTLVTVRGFLRFIVSS